MSSHKLFIGGVGYRTTAENFKEFFSKFGEIADAVTMHTSDGKSRGFGFVTFENKSDAEKVLASAPEDLELDGRRLEPKWAIPKASEVAATTKREADDYATGNFKSKKIFVGGLSAETTEDDLKEFFGTFGTITETVIMMDRDSNRSRGFGFVTFDNDDVVDTVCREKHDLGGRQVECKKAVPKEVQQSGRYRPPNNRLDRQERERGGDRRGGYGGGHGGGGRRDLSPRGRNGYDDYQRPYDRYDDYGPRGRRDPYERDYYYGGRDPYERDYYRDYYDRDGRDDRGYYRQGPPPGDYRGAPAPRAAYGERDPYYRGGDYADPRAPAPAGPPPSQSRYETSSARPAYSASSTYPPRDASQSASQASSRSAYSAPGSTAPTATSQYATQSYTTSTYSKPTTPYSSAPQASSSLYSTPASTAPYSRPSTATTSTYSSGAYPQARAASTSSAPSSAYSSARPSYSTPAASSYYPSSSSNAPGSAPPSNQYSSYAATTASTANTAANRTTRAYRPY